MDHCSDLGTVLLARVSCHSCLSSIRLQSIQSAGYDKGCLFILSRCAEAETQTRASKLAVLEEAATRYLQGHVRESEPPWHHRLRGTRLNFLSELIDRPLPLLAVSAACLTIGLWDWIRLFLWSLLSVSFAPHLFPLFARKTYHLSSSWPSFAEFCNVWPSSTIISLALQSWRKSNVTNIMYFCAIIVDQAMATI